MVDPALVEAIQERLRHAEFAQLLGMEVASIDDGSSELRLALESKHLNPGGIAHGGVIAAILDSAIGLALRTKLGMTATHVTVQLQINYLRAVRAGTITAKASAVHSGSRIGYGEGTLLDESGAVLARASASFLVIERPPGAPDTSD